MLGKWSRARREEHFVAGRNGTGQVGSYGTFSAVQGLNESDHSARRSTGGTQKEPEGEASWKAVRKSGEGVGDRTVILTVESERAE